MFYDVDIKIPNNIEDCVPIDLVSKLASDYAINVDRLGLKLINDYFNTNFIEDVIDKHMSGKENNSQIIGLLLTFELFNRMFIEGEKL